MSVWGSAFNHNLNDLFCQTEVWLTGRLFSCVCSDCVFSWQNVLWWLAFGVPDKRSWRVSDCYQSVVTSRLPITWDNELCSVNTQWSEDFESRKVGTWLQRKAHLRKVISLSVCGHLFPRGNLCALKSPESFGSKFYVSEPELRSTAATIG